MTRSAHNRIDLTGQVFSRLTVVRAAENDAGGKARWVCRCECGNETTVLGGHLRRGTQVSCGCYRTELAVRRTTYGVGRKARQVWYDMVQRCHNPDHDAFKYYGARGIAVCDRWRVDPVAFVADMGMPPAGMELDRIDNDGRYEPGNCRWATHVQNCNNTRRNQIVEFGGERHTIAEWARRRGMKLATLYGRLFLMGWTVERALSESPGAYGEPERMRRHR